MALDISALLPDRKFIETEIEKTVSVDARINRFSPSPGIKYIDNERRPLEPLRMRDVDLRGFVALWTWNWIRSS